MRAALEHRLVERAVLRPEQVHRVLGVLELGQRCGLRHSFDCDRHALLGQCIEHHIGVHHRDAPPRLRGVGRVVCLSRFLIRPAVRCRHLASHALGRVLRRVGADFEARYGYRPWLVETFVETPRYTGAVYRASGWTRVGTTQGRGRYDRHKQYDKPRKDVWLRPLRKDWKRTLNR